MIELAAVLGDYLRPGDAGRRERGERRQTLALRRLGGGGRPRRARGRRWPASYSFVHALTRQAVLDRMPRSRRTLLHARAAEALERQPADASLVARLAHHYLAAHILGFHDQALRYSREAGQLAERSLAFEDAAVWFERAASLPECEPAARVGAAAGGGGRLRAGLPVPPCPRHLRALSTPSPTRRCASPPQSGYEDATWRPGLVGRRAADLLSAALDECGLDGHDPRYVRGLGSLGRALALAGETGPGPPGGQPGDRPRPPARRRVDPGSRLTTSMWHGTTPDVADLQLERTSEMRRMAKERRDYETLGSAANFTATVSYLVGRPRRPAGGDRRRPPVASGDRPAVLPPRLLLPGPLRGLPAGRLREAEHWADETLKQNGTPSATT